MTEPRIYIGFDSRTPAAYWAARGSILRYNPELYASIYPLCQQLLRLQGLYYRTTDPLASTEFTYTRFLVPYLAGYRGMTLYLDDDVLVRGDIMELLTKGGFGKAVSVVQHDHRPTEPTKMAGQQQTHYPRKNWSSVVLFNCDHPANYALGVSAVNDWSGAQLHQFRWLDDDLIEPLDLTWNWLEGWNTRAQCPEPRIVHFTRGIPGIHPGYDKVEFAEEYLAHINSLNGDIR